MSTTKGPLKGAPAEMTVTNGKATYSRGVYNEEGTVVVGTESGGGSVTVDGKITLSGAYKPAQRRATYSASYEGSVSGDRAELTGSQVWAHTTGQTENRRCSLVFRRTSSS